MVVDIDRYLEKFYNRILKTIKRNKKNYEESVLLTIIGSRKNDARKYLIDSAISSSKIPEVILNRLLDKGLIRRGDFPNQYVLTAKGVWHHEKNINILNDDIIIEFFDDRKFDFFGEIKDLSDRDKIILMSMIATRTFSKNSYADLTENRDIWIDVVESSFEILKKMNIVSMESKNDIYGKAKAESGIVNIFRHTDKLPQKTKSIFTSKGNLKYYLNLCNEDGFSSENLSFIFWLIFKDNLTKENGEPSLSKISYIDDFLKEISANKSVYLFDLDEHEFISVDYDEVIRNSIIDSVVSRKKWSR